MPEFATMNPNVEYDKTLYSAKWDGSQWQLVRKIGDDRIRDIMRQKVNAKRNEILVSGVSFSISGQVHVLQTRDTEDLLNWTGQANEAAGMPASELVTFRTTENVTLSLPAGQFVSLIAVGIGRRKQVLAASWQLKDDIEAAESINAAYDVYEAGINSVWPADGPIVVT